MGLPPEFDEYEEGDPCAHCHEDLFDGITPKYVELELHGLIQCPGNFPPPPNGVHLLTQIYPCRWRYICIPYVYEWILGAGFSILSVDGILPGIWFFSEVETWCVDSFINELEECGGRVYAIGGTAKLRWGPTIGPQSSFIGWEVGDPCCQCESVIFSGFTPRWVNANVKGIVRCPLGEKAPPLGDFLLTQIAACTWQSITPDYILTWTIGALGSSFEILANPEGTFMFRHTTPKMCWNHFFGQKISDCAAPGVWGFEGEVSVTWGPSIVP